MRIARIVQYFQPEFGYADFYLMNAFKKFGHEVCVITSNVYSSGVKILSPFSVRRTNHGKRYEQSIPVYRLPTLFELSDQPFTFSGLKKTLKDFNPDVVHSNDLFWTITILAAHYKPMFKYKLFVDSITGTFNPIGYKTVMFKTFKLLFKRYLMKNVDGFFAVCEGSRKWLSKNFSIPSPLVNVIPLGADQNLFAPDNKTRRFMRKKLGFTDKDVVFVYTGKIIPEKDLDILIKSFALVYRKGAKNIRLLIIGNGPEKYLKYLRKLAETNSLGGKIIFLPTVDRRLLPNYYNAADVAVWPGSPSISIVEAMATGLPIIICSYPKRREDAYDTTHLLEYKNGLSFLRGDLVALAGCMENFVLDKDLIIKMGENSRRLVKEKLNWDSIALRYLEAY
jgi:glycosyltransferase involved in cell wall biosynthesis